MKRESRVKNILQYLNHYFFVFIIVAAVITCCLMLFVSTLQKTMGISFTETQISSAARVTFFNVLVVSAILMILDIIRRRYIVVRPVRKIIEAAEKISEGDFTIRIPRVKGMLGEDMFNQIGECFNKMAEELSGVETLRTDFIANVSHELKTPLAVMQNYGTMLQQPGLSEEKRLEYAKAITDASRRLAALISNILKLNKLENQQTIPHAENYMLDEQLIECLLQYENIWESKEIDIATDIEESIAVCADAELFSLVWNNLFSNAFKFTEKGGMVSVKLSADDRWATVQVKDTGCGIKPEVGAHIFEKFYQGDTSHSTQGNGLGLALVKRIVEIMQGEISVESEYGQGSSFTVKIRRYPNERLESRM